MLLLIINLKPAAELLWKNKICKYHADLLAQARDGARQQAALNICLQKAIDFKAY
jgi:hypothetical protein